MLFHWLVAVLCACAVSAFFFVPFLSIFTALCLVLLILAILPCMNGSVTFSFTILVFRVFGLTSSLILSTVHFPCFRVLEGHLRYSPFCSFLQKRVYLRLMDKTTFHKPFRPNKPRGSTIP